VVFQSRPVRRLRYTPAGREGTPADPKFPPRGGVRHHLRRAFAAASGLLVPCEPRSCGLAFATPAESFARSEGRFAPRGREWILRTSHTRVCLGEALV
jgi:hypothetical protein